MAYKKTTDGKPERLFWALLCCRDKLFECFFWLEAHCFRNRLSVFEHHKCRDTLDLESARYFWVLVNVEFDDLDLVAHLLVKLFEYRCDHAARSTPSCPEIDEDDALFYFLFKCLSRCVFNSHLVNTSPVRCESRMKHPHAFHVQSIPRRVRFPKRSAYQLLTRCLRNSSVKSGTTSNKSPTMP